MKEKRELRLFIAIPSMQEWTADFSMSMVLMTAYLTHPVPGFTGCGFTVHNKKGSILAGMRQSLVELALKMRSTHLLFIDSDQTFPKDMAHRLLVRRKPVVACNVATKCFPSNPTARLKSSDFKGELVYTRPGDVLCQKVWRVGTGIMMIDLSIFNRPELRDVRDLFPQRWSDETGTYVGEDWGFCERLEAARVPIYVDHGLSWEVGHIGKVSYDHSFVMAAKPEAISV